MALVIEFFQIIGLVIINVIQLIKELESIPANFVYCTRQIISSWQEWLIWIIYKHVINNIIRLFG